MPEVKIPRKVADAIIYIRQGFAESSLHDIKWLEGETDDNEMVRKMKNIILDFIAKKGYPDQFSPNHPLIIYHKALVNGYGIEETPEEKVRKTFVYALEQIDNLGDHPQAEHWKGMKTGIIVTLASLNIIIKGVNDHE